MGSSGRDRFVAVAAACLMLAACGRGGPWDRPPRLDLPSAGEAPSPPRAPCTDPKPRTWRTETVHDGDFQRVAAVTDANGALHVSYIGAGIGAASGLWYTTNINQAFERELVAARVPPHDTDIALTSSGEAQLAWFARAEGSGAMGVYLGRRTSQGWDARVINPQGRLWNQVRYSHVSLDVTVDGRSHLMFRTVANQIGFAHGAPGAWEYGFQEVFTATLPVASSSDGQGRIATAYHARTYHRSDQGRVVEVQGDLRLHEEGAVGAFTVIESVRVPVTSDRPPGPAEILCGSAVALARGRDDALHAVYGFPAEDSSGERRCGLRHAVRRAGVWSHVTVLSQESTPWVAVDIDLRGATHVAYVTPEGQVGYASDQSGAFRAELVPGAAAVTPAIAAGPDSTAHVVYYDEQSEAVRVARRDADERCR